MSGSIFFALAIVLSVGAQAARADGSFFFQNGQEPQRQRAALPDQERDRLLRDAYACSRPGKTPQEEQRCRALDERVRQTVSERVRANHGLAGQQIQELKSIHRRQVR